MDRETDRQRDKHTDKETDKDIDKLTGWQKHQKDGQR